MANQNLVLDGLRLSSSYHKFQEAAMWLRMMMQVSRPGAMRGSWATLPEASATSGNSSWQTLG